MVGCFWHGSGTSADQACAAASLSGTTADDPALADTWGLGRLLYAALAGRTADQSCWSGPIASMLDSASLGLSPGSGPGLIV